MYLNWDNGECLQCEVEHCSNCYEDVCFQCDSGYEFNSDFQSCVDAAVECESDSCDECWDPETCGVVNCDVETGESWELWCNKTCEIEGCLECWNAAECKRCNQSMGIRWDELGLASSCSSCPDGCADCVDSDSCTGCENGYALD
eukprot:808139_1